LKNHHIESKKELITNPLLLQPGRNKEAAGGQAKNTKRN
jgi:hypothetical protein